ncbi:hypothetical protein V6N13_064869 [Hibiscus sabdariffa]|uniref:Uncharacterized protein n=1 Tax=Hibiscus sabdariffa TaxID=183260 RepID=A0ABR2EBF1_9ROSI
MCSRKAINELIPIPHPSYPVRANIVESSVATLLPYQSTYRSKPCNPTLVTATKTFTARHALQEPIGKGKREENRDFSWLHNRLLYLTGFRAITEHMLNTFGLGVTASTYIVGC